MPPPPPACVAPDMSTPLSLLDRAHRIQVRASIEPIKP